MRVLFMTNVLSFYRMDFFNELGKYCDLTVSYEKDTIKDYGYKNFYSQDNKYFKLVKAKKSILSIAKLLNNNYDIIIVGTYSTTISAKAIMYMKLKKIKFIINADGGFVKNDGFIKNYIKRFFISKASYWLSTGNMTDNYLIAYGANPDAIYHYSFTSLFENEISKKIVSEEEKRKLRKKYNIPLNKKIFITIGRLYYIKGNDIIIDNVIKNSYSDCEFYIISGGPLKDEYIKKIESNNVKNIHLIDYLSRKEIYDFLKLSDVMIMPSRGDVWGLVINEAMSVGLPIISSNRCIAGVELLDNEYIFDVNNIDDLTLKVNKILRFNKEKLSKLSNNNLKKIKKYTIENMAKEHIKIMDDIIERGKL